MSEHDVNGIRIISLKKTTRHEIKTYIDIVKEYNYNITTDEFEDDDYMSSQNTMLSDIKKICVIHDINKNINIYVNNIIRNLYMDLAKSIISNVHDVYDKHANILYVDNSLLPFKLHYFKVSIYFYYKEIRAMSFKNKNYFYNKYRHVFMTY